MISKYVLVGEFHGTKECSKAFLELAMVHKVKDIALEVDRSYQKELDSYLKGKRHKLSFLAHKGPHDGRTTPALKKLIDAANKLDIRVHLVDGPAFSGPEARDEQMAKSLMKIKNRVAFLCGNVHASKIKFKGQRTCGTFLPRHQTVSYNIIPLNGGRFYNFRIGRYERNEKLYKKYKRAKLPMIIKSDTAAYDYLYLINRFTPSK
ncbi:MAG TPA: hypothetical protein VL944_02045 [Candidatus Acidoferrum sp.]|nr:hypothetical protein [Candidatus Acidoferrum sp.]